MFWLLFENFGKFFQSSDHPGAVQHRCMYRIWIFQALMVKNSFSVYCSLALKITNYKWRHDIQHSDTQHNDILYNDTRHNNE
jgi:hypothetical protein